MTDLEKAIERHVQRLIGNSLRTGTVVPTASLFRADTNEVSIAPFYFSDNDEKHQMIDELRELIRETQPDAAMLMLEVFMRSSNDMRPKDALIIMVEFPDRPRFFKSYDCEMRDGKLVDLHPHKKPQNLSVFGMELFDPPTTH